MLDTSYSVSGELVEHFLQETFTILTESDSFFVRNKIRIIPVSYTHLDVYKRQHYESANVPQTVIKTSGRELNNSYQEKLIGSVVWHYSKKLDVYKRQHERKFIRYLF